MHSTKVLVCKQACSMPTVQPAVIHRSWKGRNRPERGGEGWREHARAGETRGSQERE